MVEGLSFVSLAIFGVGRFNPFVIGDNLEYFEFSF